MPPKDHVMEFAEMAAKGSRVGVCGDGTERITCWSLRRRHRAVAKSVGDARPPVVLRAVERLLDMEHGPALRCLERLRKRIEHVEKEGSPSFLSPCDVDFSSHRRTSTGEVSSPTRSHVICVSNHKKINTFHLRAGAL